MAGMLTAPHTLTLLGNLAGLFQWMLLPLMFAAMAGFTLNNASLVALVDPGGRNSGELDGLSAAVGPFKAAFFLTAGRMITAVTLSTVLLVTAGFAFNETFAYWFPNFGFAFLLLALVLAAQIFGIRACRRFQLATASLALLGILLLIAVGLVGLPANGPITLAGRESMSTYRLSSILLLFVGFEAALNHRVGNAVTLTRAIPAVLGLIGGVLALWGVVSMGYIPSERLADSFIPHVITAKSIAGQTGRMIMAVVVIASGCAAVNALFTMVSRTVVQIMRHGTPPVPSSQRTRQSSASAVLCSLGVAAMMATGMAGTDQIDVYVRSGLYSWLLCYGVVHLGALIQLRRMPAPRSAARQVTAFAGMVLMCLAIVALMANDPDRTVLLQFTLLSWAMVALFLGGIWYWKKIENR